MPLAVPAAVGSLQLQRLRDAVALAAQGVELDAEFVLQGPGFRSRFNDWARQHDVDELLLEFTRAHVEGSATVAAYSRDDLLEKRRLVMQRWAGCVAASRSRSAGSVVSGYAAAGTVFGVAHSAVARSFPCP